MAAKRTEKLPKGFHRTPANSLRVQIRITGHKPEVRTFPLFADTPFERQRQRDEAEAWATETRRKLRGGVFVSTRGAEAITLGDALRKYEREKLDPEVDSQRKDINRIRQILTDPIAARSVSALRPTDVAAYRDELIRRGWLGKVDAARHRAVESGADRRRLREIDGLPALRAACDAESDPTRRRRLLKDLAELETREAITTVARTTISNKTQLISRALKHLGQTVEGVPDVTGTSMPRASPGRDRRLVGDEYDRLRNGAAEVGAVLALAFSFAVETALRRERILEVAPRHLVDIGGGRLVILFPKERRARKRTGIVPVTANIRLLLEEAAALQGRAMLDASQPARPFFDVNGNTFDHRWRALVLDLQIEDLHFHDLRHEATSRLFERGLTTAEVMSITGHSTTEMVDRYSHYSASIVFDKLVDGPDPERIFGEISLLVAQFRACSGDVARIGALLG